LEVLVQALQPVAAHPAAISAAGPLRHNPIESQLARLGEHERALGVDRLAERDAVDAMDEPRKLVSPLLERTIAEISGSAGRP
jgi:hypothetical protein